MEWRRMAWERRWRRNFPAGSEPERQQRRYDSLYAVHGHFAHGLRVALAESRSKLDFGVSGRERKPNRQHTNAQHAEHLHAGQWVASDRFFLSGGFWQRSIEHHASLLEARRIPSGHVLHLPVPMRS